MPRYEDNRGSVIECAALLRLLRLVTRNLVTRNLVTPKGGVED